VRAPDKFTLFERLTICVAPLLAGMLTLNYQWQRNAEARLAETNNRVELLRTAIARQDARIVVRDQHALEEKLQVLATLENGRTRPAKVLDELSTIIPRRVWISGFGEQAGVATIQGFALGYEDLASFAEKLKGSKFFSNVTIQKASQQIDNRIDWEIVCRPN
jgi:type IV pilus assembly protein PilN